MVIDVGDITDGAILFANATFRRAVELAIAEGWAAAGISLESDAISIMKFIIESNPARLRRVSSVGESRRLAPASVLVKYAIVVNGAMLLAEIAAAIEDRGKMILFSAAFKSAFTANTGMEVIGEVTQSTEMVQSVVTATTSPPEVRSPDNSLPEIDEEEEPLAGGAAVGVFLACAVSFACLSTGMYLYRSKKSMEVYETKVEAIEPTKEQIMPYSKKVEVTDLS